MQKLYLIPALQPFSGLEIYAGTALYCFRQEEIIKRSRFITSCGAAPDRATARLFVNAIKTEFASATHNCWAYNAGPPGSTADIGQSDDGEPHGTAGKPMLSHLLRCEVGEIVMVVTRFFGGIKLGTGGLVRAYQGCAAKALLELPTIKKFIPATLSLEVDYAMIGRVQDFLATWQARILQEDYGATVRILLQISTERVEPFMRAIRDLTDGKTKPREINL